MASEVDLDMSHRHHASKLTKRQRCMISRERIDLIPCSTSEMRIWSLAHEYHSKFLIMSLGVFLSGLLHRFTMRHEIDLKNEMK